jgi:adenosylcobinamide-GDP ribazoletransferase
VGFADAPAAASLVALPIVGALIGALSGIAGYGVSLVAPIGVAVAVAFGATIALSGAIHLDGFLDSCDALFASVPPNRRLEIMKDPRHGTYALAGLATIVTIWVASCATIAPHQWPLAFAVFGALARAASVVNALFVPYARGGAVTRAFEERPAAWILIVELLILAAAAYALVPWCAALVPGAVILALVTGAFARRQLGGGLVGDSYGFAIVVVETWCLAVVAGRLVA